MHRLMSECKECTRHSTRQLDTPFFGIGNLNADIMFVGESPGYQTRQLNGITFCGNCSGDYFFDLLSEVKLHAGNCYITNVVKCQKANNEKPSSYEIGECKKYLDAEIKMVNPKIIVGVGSVAANAICAGKTTFASLRRSIIRKQLHSYTAVYHPAYLLRNSHLNLHDEFISKLRFIKKEIE